MVQNGNNLEDRQPAKFLLVVFSYHHMNTEKVAKDHATLREKLQAKGYLIADEFALKMKQIVRKQ